MTMRYRLRTLMIVLASLVAAPAFGQEKNDPGDALYGEWEVVEMIFHGKVQDFGIGNGGWFLFEPGGFIRSFNEEQRRELDNQRVKALLMERCFIGRREIDIRTKFLSREGDWRYSLYELKDGKLRIVYREDNGPRPTHFDALKDDRLTLFVLKKVK
jgi:uncharacterized protein (TIGR03067 family)